MADRYMLGAASLFGVTTVFATAVSAREPELPAEALGIRIPGPVPVALALGLGSGIAAPWPMPVAAMWAAARARPGAVGPPRALAALGAMVLMGTVLEPATWGLRPRSRLARATVPLHVLSGTAMLAAGMRGAEAQSAPAARSAGR